jgi:hypothetical protein
MGASPARMSRILRSTREGVYATARLRPLLRSSIFVLLALAPLPARGAEVASGPTQEPLATATRFGIESTWARFDLKDYDHPRGDYFEIAARADDELSRTVTLRLVVPFYVLSLDDADTRTGIGDVELRLKVQAAASENFRLYLGVADELPTGIGHLGLGNGAEQLSPYVTVGRKVGKVIFYTTVADTFSLRSNAAPQNYVSPNEDHELDYNVGTIFQFTDAFYANLAPSAVTVLVPSKLGSTLVTGGAQLGLQPSEAWKIVGGFEVPMLGDHRFETRATLDAYAFF